ncbi:Uricase [Sphaceloma murrayae]|uniref:Uricase n=1 Tax=Sphaceloma murrayae TaxID=2082308 RepID=A0A2K1QFW0_9PEZI|nr:Uricase [Sphaceloma murrayae]
MAQLSQARYGKDNIRLYKVHKEADGTQSVCELTVKTMLEGDIETSYTRADNSVVVATDTQKQTTYVLAKQHPVTPPELFASILANHFVTTYAHIHAAHVSVIVHRWTRLTVDGKPHPHSFMRDGEEKRTCEAVAREGQGITVKSGINGLLVLKSTGSAFYGFHRDEYTRLPETWDRILSTEVEATWHWKQFSDLSLVEKEAAKFDKAWESARRITLDTFAKDESPSVQNTMYKMSEQILADVPDVDSVDYVLPNKHYFEIDLSWFNGLKNTGKDAEVYAPQSDPNGLITCSVSRK